MILISFIFASIIPSIFNLIKNMNLNKIFMEEIKKILNLRQTNESSVASFRINEFQSLLKSMNTLNCVNSRERIENRRKYSLDERVRRNKNNEKRRRTLIT